MNRFRIMQRLQVGAANPPIKVSVDEEKKDVKESEVRVTPSGKEKKDVEESEVRVTPSGKEKKDVEESAVRVIPSGKEKKDVEESEVRVTPSGSNVTENQESRTGGEIRREASSIRDCQGDYLDVPSNSYLMKILAKQGDKKVRFADKVLKFTGSGKTKRRFLLISDRAMYIVDPDFDALKRRIALDDIEGLCLSELSDNFFAIIIPKEYDLLMASTRKAEIVTVLSEISLSAYQYELEVTYTNRFTYNAAAEFMKEVQFEEIEGGIKTRILNSLP